MAGTNYGGGGGWWKIDGRRWQGGGRHICRPYGVTGTDRRSGQDPSLRCGRLEGGYGKVRGPGMPGPYGVAKGKRVLAGRCAGGMNPSPTVW